MLPFAKYCTRTVYLEFFIVVKKNKIVVVIDHNNFITFTMNKSTVSTFSHDTSWLFCKMVL